MRDVIRQFRERSEDGIEVLAELEADDVLRWRVADVLHDAVTEQKSGCNVIEYSMKP